ncbi:MAG TPA: glycine cleavage T C-terminal barrel domain-containing protein [Longimicrobiaceae bacterium]|nr:glycine cleavage T C-terminal barrel domain-containing protein [Longimicrobiaceae bacterium]
MSTLREAEEARGAVFGEVAGASVPRHFGDSRAEYETVRTAAGVADRGDRARIRMWGKDPAKMLHGLITNDLLKVPAGRGVYAAMLNPKGRMIADLRALRVEREGAPEVLVDVAREALAGTREHLKKFVPPMFARWEDASDSLACVGVYGPLAHQAVARVLADVPRLDEDAFAEAAFGDAGVVVLATRELGVEGYDLFVPAEQAGALWEALVAGGAEAGVRPIGFGTIETLRVEAGRPRYGAELTEEVIATEAFESTGLMERAISFNKGCYTGQEVIVRIAHRGHVNRLLRGLLLGDVPTPDIGTPLFNPETGREAGRITSVAVSPRMGQTIALGYVRRELAPDAAVRVGAADGAEATVSALPFGADGTGG